MRFGVRGSRREIRNEKISILVMAPAHFLHKMKNALLTLEGVADDSGPSPVYPVPSLP